MKIKNIITIIIAIFLSALIVIYQNNQEKNNEPVVLYRVYLDGEDIGLIESREKLEDYINVQQEKLKQKYNVSQIHIPNNINIVKDITYDEDVSSVEVIYNKINNISPFTIEGYQITIDKTNSSIYANDDNVLEDEEKIIHLYVLNKDIFVEAVKNAIMSFVSIEDYEAFINENQTPIVTTGELIEDIYIDDEITIKEAYITVSETIYMDANELTKYLIFGEHANDETYIVKAGDTIDEIASKNEMSVNELLIANNDIRSETSLLYVGQKLNIGTLNPVFTTIIEKHVVTDQTAKFTTTYKYDRSKQTGYSKILQEGSNGVNRVTQKVKLINGEISTAYIAASEEIVPMIDKIVLRGGDKPTRGDGNWVWPTKIMDGVGENCMKLLIYVEQVLVHQFMLLVMVLSTEWGG